MWELFLSSLIVLVPVVAVFGVTFLRVRVMTRHERIYSPDRIRTSSLRSINAITIISAVCGTVAGVVGAVFAALHGANYFAMACGFVALISVVAGTAFVISGVLSYERIEGGKLYAKRFAKTKEIPLEDIAYFYHNDEKNYALILYDCDKKPLLTIPPFRLGKTMIARVLQEKGKTRVDKPIMQEQPAKNGPKNKIFAGIIMISVGVVLSAVATLPLIYGKPPTFGNQRIVGKLSEYEYKSSLTIRLEDDQTVYAVHSYVMDKFDKRVLGMLEKGDELVLYAAYEDNGTVYISRFERDGVVFLTEDDARQAEEDEAKFGVVMGVILMICGLGLVGVGVVFIVKGRRLRKKNAASGAKQIS